MFRVQFMTKIIQLIEGAKDTVIIQGELFGQKSLCIYKSWPSSCSKLYISF